MISVSLRSYHVPVIGCHSYKLLQAKTPQHPLLVHFLPYYGHGRVWGKGEWALCSPFSCTGGCVASLESHFCLPSQPCGLWAPLQPLSILGNQSYWTENREYRAIPMGKSQSHGSTTKAALLSLTGLSRMGIKPCSMVCLKFLRFELCICQLEETHFNPPIFEVNSL